MRNTNSWYLSWNYIGNYIAKSLSDLMETALLLIVVQWGKLSKIRNLVRKLSLMILYYIYYENKGRSRLKVRSFEMKKFLDIPRAKNCQILLQKKHIAFVLLFLLYVLLYLLLLIAMVGHLSCSKATLIEKMGLNSLFPIPPVKQPFFFHTQNESEITKLSEEEVVIWIPTFNQL